MNQDAVSPADIAAIGIQIQLAGSLLCLLLGIFLSRGANRQRWLTWWTAAFGAISLALLVLMVRYFGYPLIPIEALTREDSSLVGGIYAVYEGAKLLFYCFLLAGTWSFATRRPLPRVGIGAGLVLVVASVSLLGLAPTELNAVMIWQAGFAVPALLLSAWLLHRMPDELRTRGSRLLSWVFVAQAALWGIYVPGFAHQALPELIRVPGLFQWLVARNSYLDVLFEFLLGFGMLLAILDDAFRKAEVARTRRLREVAESEARLAQIIRAASEGILLLDPEQRIVHGNPAALAMLGVSGAEAVGAPIGRFLAVGAPEGVAAGGAEPALQPLGTSGSHRMLGRRADGREFPLELSLRAITADPARGFVLTVRDRTQQVQEEAERARTQLQLAEAARMESIGRMVSGVAHELNNPLTAILAFSQDLAGHSRSPADAEALQTIVTQAQRCRSIVQDLLVTARSTRAARELVQLEAVVARALPALERQAAERGIRLQVEAAPMPPVEATPSALEQVLTNLVVNAMQAQGRGGEVRVRLAARDGRVTLEVEDNGPGIRPEVLPRLFEPFFTTKAAGEGTGLGLAVSRALAEQQGGTLTAANRSEPGETGARFTLELPVAAGGAWTPAVAVGPATATSRRVLVVDDEAPIRVALRRFLERRGWVVEEAGDGREALHLLGLGSGSGGRPPVFFDVIVSDLRMPGLSGIELHDRIAASAPGLLQRLVLLTGDSTSSGMTEFLRRSRQPLLHKPFDLPVLADLLDRIAPAPPPRSA